TGMTFATNGLFAKPSHPTLELGVLTFSFHEITEGGMPAVDQMIADTHSLGLRSVEVYSPQLSPFPMPEGFYKRWQDAAHPGAPSAPMPSPEQRQQRREQLRQWRESLPPDYLPSVRNKFKAAGIAIFALNYSFDATMTDAEIDSGFVQAKALGTTIITAASPISVAERVVPFAERHRMAVAFHNTTSTDPDRIVTPDAYAKLLAMSPWYRINLDVAHFASAGYDPVAFIGENHRNIVSLHLHDRKKNSGPSVPNGEGDTPLREILLLLRSKHLKIPLFYELEWIGSGQPIPEIERDLQYLRGLAT
ncbi:MAG TPA: TIM barrel protein, partial [Edaphobacter sp.]